MSRTVLRKRRTAHRFAVIGLLLLLAGCADANSAGNSDKPKSGGFYGGMVGGALP